MHLTPASSTVFTLVPPYGERAEPAEGHHATKYELMMEIEEDPSGLICRLVYSTDLFKAETIARFLKHFEQLLESIVIDPDQKIGHIALYQKTELHLLLKTWNETFVPTVSPHYVHERFEEQVTRIPERPALWYQGAHLTYRQLNEHANQLAHYLQRCFKLGPDVAVCLCLERSFDLIIAILGILKAGGAYVPLDPHLPPRRLQQMVQSINSPVVITHTLLWEQFQVSEYIPILYLDASVTELAKESTENCAGETHPDLLAYILHTSDSTGFPKGVMVTHGGLANYLQWACKAYNVCSESKILLHSPITFDLSVTSLFLALITGGALEIMPEFDGFEGLRTALQQSDRQSLLKLTPSHLKLFNQDAALLQKFAGKVKVLVVGGEALLAEDLQTWQTLSSTTRIINEYGPTETVVGCSFHEVDGSDHGLIPIGRPLINTQIYLLSSCLEPVPVGAYGELYIGGVALARGYLNQPGLAAERFIRDPFSSVPGQRLYRTGDIARYRPDGILEYRGRIDNQIKVRGYRIELGEIEAALREHADVLDVVVLSTNNQTDAKILVAYFVAAQTAASSTTELRQFLRNRLPEYMLPAVLIRLDKLPLTGNGKVDYRSLPPINLTEEQREDYKEILSPLEKLILTIWSEVLGVKASTKVDNFFVLGGHSLHAVQVSSRLSLLLGIELPMRLLFEYPTADNLARQIETIQHSKTATRHGPIEQTQREGSLPLSFAQERIWLIQQIDPKNPFYSNIDVLQLKGQLNLQTLQQSLDKLVERHESLRTTFRFIDGHLSQVISQPTTVPLPLLDLSDLAEDAKTIEIQSIVQTYAHQAFNLEHGPLLRAMLLRENKESLSHILALHMHHIVTDGWSMNILRKEMQSMYASQVNHQPISLPILPIQYADFAAWQRRHLQGTVLENQLTFWKNQLADAPALLAIPTDHPRPAVQTFRGKRQEIVLSLLLLEHLKNVGQQVEATLFMTLLAAFQVLLSWYSGQQDIVVGTPIANRQSVELEGLVGFFANTLVLRGDLSGRPTFLQLLEQVRRVCLEAYAHQDLPFEKLIEELQPIRHLSHNPLFQVMFTLQNTPLDRMMGKELIIEQVPIFINAAKFDLLMAASESENGLRIFLEYNVDLFEAQTITQMLHYFHKLLAELVQNPNKKLEALSLLTASEARQVSNLWTRTGNSIPLSEDITRLFEMQVEQTPHLPALILEHELLSYEELNQRVNQLAHYLQAIHVGPEILVAVYMDRSIATLVSILAVLKAGGAYIPLEVDMPIIRLSHILTDAQVGVVITHSELSNNLPQTSAHIIYLDSESEQIKAQPVCNPQRWFTLDNLAYIIYTSGSTGNPKGVAVAHAQLLSYLGGILPMLKLTEGASLALVSTFAADLGHTVIFPALCRGGCLHIISYERMIDASKLTQYCQKQQIDYVKIVPSHLKALLQHKGSTHLLPHKCLLLGGEATPWELIDEIKALRPECHILNHYGPTETTVGVLSYELGSSLEERRHGVVPLRSPIGKNRVYVLDSNYQPVAAGIPGELYIAGENLARGYLNAPDLTAAHFLPCPFGDQPGTRLYKTGDLVRFTSDGMIEFLRQINSQVKIRGFRVELTEIEAVLQKHPWIKETRVFLQENATGEAHIVASVVPHRRHTPTIDERQRYRLPNNLAILHLNKHETDYIYKEVFELQAYTRYGITLRKNDCIFDVGADIGLFTLFAYATIGKLQAYVFEPGLNAFEILRTNLQLYEIQAKLFNIGLAKSERIADFVAFEGFSLFSGFHTDTEQEKLVVKSFMQNQRQAGLAEMHTLLEHADTLLEERFQKNVRATQLRTLSSIIEQEHTRQ